MTDDADEPRVRDLLRRDDGDESELMAWFERPSFAHLTELAAAMPAPPPRPEDDPEVVAIRKRREEVIARVDPRLLAHILRHDDLDGLTRLPPPLPGFDERPPMLRFDEAAVPAIPDADSWPIRERGDELDDAVKTCTPQAFLRDLHRPVKDFEILHESAFSDLPEAVGLDTHIVAVREAVTTNWRLRDGFPSAAPQIAEHYADRRSLMTRPWADAKSARAKQAEAELLGKEAEAAAVPSGPEPSP
jgi:hypothetical protein